MTRACLKSACGSPPVIPEAAAHAGHRLAAQREASLNALLAPFNAGSLPARDIVAVLRRCTSFPLTFYRRLRYFWPIMNSVQCWTDPFVADKDFAGRRATLQNLPAQ